MTPRAVAIGAAAVLTGCVRPAAPPVQRCPAPAAAEEPPPRPPPAPSRACPPPQVVSPALAITPHFNRGKTRVYLAPCIEPGKSPAAEAAPEDESCGHASPTTFEICSPDVVKQAVSIATFLTAPSLEGEKVALRGRLGVSGPRAPGEAASLGLISDWEHQDACLMANLVPGANGPADLWRCTKPASESDQTLCCNESAARPPTGVDIIVLGTVKKLLFGPRVQIWALGDVEAHTFCVIRGTQ